MAGMTDPEAVSRQLLREEIERIVADAKAAEMTLNTAAHAARLFAAYPGAHYSVGRIVDELVVAATAAGLPVEIARFERT